MHRARTDEDGQRRLQEVVWEWNECWRTVRPVLHVYDGGKRLHFFDTRPDSRKGSWTAEGLAAEIYRLCESAQTSAGLIRQLSEQRSAEVTMQELQPAIDGLVESRALLSLNGKL